MRWSATLEAWARREAVLVSFLAAATAMAGLAVPLRAPWLAGVGAVVAVVAVMGAVVRAVIAVHRARLEGQREQAESARLLRVPVAPIGRIDPTLIGVDRAAPSVLDGDVVPKYVGRAVDAALREAVEAALDSSGPWLVVVDGGSKVGKSRTLFEALRRCAPAGEMECVAPVDAAALRSLLNPGPSSGKARRLRRAVAR